MRQGGSLLLAHLLLLLQPLLGEAHAVRETERRHLQQGIITTTGEVTVIAGTDYCCSNGLSTATATAATARRRRRKLNTQPHIGWTDPGDWVAYPVQLPSSGVYQVHFHVSSLFGDGSFELLDMATQQVYGVVDTMPITNDWDTFETISLSVTLPAGLVSLQVRILSAGWNLLWIAVNGGEGGIGTIPVVIAPPPPLPDVVVVSPDEVTVAPSASAVDGTLVPSTMAPTAVLALDDDTTFPTITNTNATSPPLAQLPSKPAPAMTPVMMPVPSTRITLSPVEKTPVASIPLPTPLVVAPTVPPNGGTTKPPPLHSTNKRPFLHEFITAENIIRSSPTIVWETSDKEQRTQAAELKKGDWLEFRLAIPIAGPYQVHVRASSPRGDGAFELVHVESIDDVMDSRMPDMTANETETSLGTFTGFPMTGTWDEYDRMEQEIMLPASPAKSGLLMRIYILEPGFNLVWLYVEPSDLWDAIDARDDVN